MINKKNIFIDLILFILTGSLWTFWMQYRQIRDYNRLVGRKEFSFLILLILSIVTIGFYHIYHEYKITKSIYIAVNAGSNPETPALIAIVLTIFLGWIFVDMYQQELLNRRAQ